MYLLDWSSSSSWGEWSYFSYQLPATGMKYKYTIFSGAIFGGHIASVNLGVRRPLFAGNAGLLGRVWDEAGDQDHMLTGNWAIGYGRPTGTREG